MNALNGNFANYYPSNMLPEVACGAIEDIVNVAKVSHALAGAAVLTTMSAAIQRVIKVVLPSTESARSCGLYMATSVDTAGGKTPTQELAMKPLREHDEAAQAEYDVSRKRYRAAMQVWANKKRALLAGDLDSPEVAERLREHFENEPVMPKCRSLLSSDISERAVLEALEGSGQALAVIFDEGKVLLKDSFQEKVGALNTAWSGGSMQLERAGGVRLVVRDPRVTMSIMVQPDVLKEFLAKRRNASLRGSGFLARFLFSAPPSTQGYRWRTAEVPSTDRLDVFHERVKEILAHGDAVAAGKSEEVLLRFDADAARRWVDIANYMDSMTRPGNAWYAIADFVSKAPEQIARIAAISHYFGNQPGSISVETVERARSVVEYHLYEFKAMFDSPPPPPEWVQDSIRLEQYLFRAYWNAGVVCAEKNAVLRRGPVRGSPRFEPALHSLVKQGKIFVMADAKGKHFIWRSGTIGMPTLLPPQ